MPHRFFMMGISGLYSNTKCTLSYLLFNFKLLNSTMRKTKAYLPLKRR